MRSESQHITSTVLFLTGENDRLNYRSVPSIRNDRSRVPVNSIFLSYRREDSEWVSGLLHERLAAHFGSDAIFTDIDSIPLGVNFTSYIEEQVGKCDIFLAVIGENWLNVTDENGRPRLQQPRDFVRLEIESALKREIPVIPLLVGNVVIPPADKLPVSLRELAIRNGTPIRPKPTFESDVGRLIRGIERHLRIMQVKAEKTAATGKIKKAAEAERLAEEQRMQEAATDKTKKAAAVKPVEAEVEKRPLRGGSVFRDTLMDSSRGPKMVVIPAGDFFMGSPKTEEGRASDEGPLREINVPAFAMGITVVTFEEYNRFAKSIGRALPFYKSWRRRGYPVTDVSWNDAVEYAEWLSARTHKTYRLPSEAQWEYAARAGTTTRFWWGDEVGEGHTNDRSHGSKWRGIETAPVGSFPPNAFGLHDTAGNVWEWVQDCYSSAYYDAPVDGSAREELECSKRVLRGGSWLEGESMFRSANRHYTSPASRYSRIGFRLARDL